jgi:glucosamine-6-phosphate deaminase
MSSPSVAVVDAAAFDRAGADALGAIVRAQPRATVVVATGRTPMGAYHLLAGDLPRGTARHLRAFQLDEYVGVGPDDPRSLYGWMHRGFVAPLGIEEVVRFDGLAADLDRECRAYEEAVRAAGGFDVAVLGLGPNGHLGFNEPPSDPSSVTRVVALTPASVAANATYWPGSDVPERALTAGLDVLLAARHVLLLVSGAAKRDILRKTLRGPVTPEVPASFLQRHPSVHLIADAHAWAA